MLHLIAGRSRRLALVVLGLVVAALVAGVLTRSAHAQGAPAQGAPSRLQFAYIANNDTIAVESIEQAAGVVRGSLAYRGQPRIDWEQQREPMQLAMRAYAAGAPMTAAPLQAFVFRVQGDSLQVEITANGATRTQSLPVAAGTVPLIGQSLMHAALVASFARAAGRTTLPVVLTNGAQKMEANVVFTGDTSVMTMSGLAVQTAWRAGLPLEVRVPAQGLRAVRMTGAPAPSAATGRYDYSAPTGAPYTAEAVTIPTSRGYTLAGTLTRPVRSARVPVVITISGSGPQERDSRLSGLVAGYAPFRDIADTLSRRGIAVLRYDDRGVGESGGAASRAQATSVDFADDVLSVVAWLRTRPDIDPARIMLAGHSEGGIIAPIAAVKDPRIHAIALLAGSSYDGRHILNYQVGNQVKALLAAPAGEATRAAGRARGLEGPALQQFMTDSIVNAMITSNAWTKYFAETDPKVMLRQVRQPVLVLQGDTDWQVTPEQADTIVATLRAAGNTRVTMQRFPATNHLLVPDPVGSPTGYGALKDVRVRKEVLGALADWVERIAR